MAKQNPTKIQCAVVRTPAGLRDALFDEWDRLRRGESNATNANAISRMAATITESAVAELEMHKTLAALPPREKLADRLPNSIPLGQVL